MRYSKQRELVMQTVENLCDHPTAEEIYDTAAKECPGLSLGTVYRNLNSLVEAGRVRRVSIPGQADRFDHTLAWHSHLYCTVCGGVTDAEVAGDEAGTRPERPGAGLRRGVHRRVRKLLFSTKSGLRGVNFARTPLPAAAKECILRRAIHKSGKKSVHRAGAFPGGEGWFDWNTLVLSIITSPLIW